MDLQERYEELDNIVRTLDILIDEISDKEYIEQLRETKYEAENEMQEIEPLLQEQFDREEEELERQYWREAI